MIFNSLPFLYFFPIVTLLFFLIPKKWKNLEPRLYFLLAASCYFYMYFIPIYILVLFAAIIIDYWAGLKIQSATDPTLKKRYLWISIISTCSLLFFFKYINFAITSWNDIQNILGWNYSLTALKIILPVGLSFHTFQSLSYVIEVYYGRFPAERNFFRYSLFVMYYPQLVAGPIERPQTLLPQLKVFKDFDWQNIRQGLQMMLWGFFKKVVVADRISYIIGPVFLKPENYTALTLILTGLLFSHQIYGDFSGYSDIAIGASKCMGITLSQNFKTPQFSTTFNEFWQRWHITLSQWLHTYIFLPLGGLRGKSVFKISRIRKQHSTITYKNIFITFIISGLWHGANWTFLLWSFINGCLVIAEHLLKKLNIQTTRSLTHNDSTLQKEKKNQYTGSILVIKKHLTSIIKTVYQFVHLFFQKFPKIKMFYILLVVSLTELIFRAFSIHDVKTIFFRIFRFEQSGFFFANSYLELIILLFSIIILHKIDWKIQKSSFSNWINDYTTKQRWFVYIFLLFLILFIGVFGKEKYVYFQF